MPVAMMTWSAITSSPSRKRRRLPAPASSIPSSCAPVRTVTPRSRSQPVTTSAPVASIMRGRICGAISTTVSRAPNSMMEFRMVKAMNPAPTIATEQPADMPRITPCACSSVQKLCTPAPSAPSTGARTGDEPVAISRLS